MIEKPLERLNYYNGQRLEASDLKLEQEYHIRVRRWLNRSLYSPGIARGLEVRKEEGRTVVISPGLALDAEGHEIILLEEAREVVPGRGRHRPGPGSEAEVEGLYLTIRYNEQTVAEEHGVCFARASGDDVGRSRPASGGPARIDATPIFSWRAFLPHEGSGEIALAQVELDPNCEYVHQMNVGVRRYVGAASAAKVRQYALDGEKDIDSANPGRIYFHIRGRQPNAVTLYLRAEKFSSLYYTEMGKHNHVSHVNNDTQPVIHPASHVDAHMHTDPNDLGTQLIAAEEVMPVSGTGHTHTLKSNILRSDNPAGFAHEKMGFLVGTQQFLVAIAGATTVFEEVKQADLSEYSLSVSPTGHAHAVVGRIGSLTKRPWVDEKIALHTHTIQDLSVSLDDAGVEDPSPAPPVLQAYTARRGDPLTYVDRMEVWIGKDEEEAVDQTDSICDQLADVNSIDWPTGMSLGNGKGDHPLVRKGTGPIRLDFLPDLYFTEGQFYIELRIPKGTDGKPNGGRVLYNLYVE